MSYSPSVSSIARELGLVRPIVPQSMYIFKQVNENDSINMQSALPYYSLLMKTFAFNYLSMRIKFHLVLALKTSASYLNASNFISTPLHPSLLSYFISTITFISHYSQLLVEQVIYFYALFVICLVFLYQKVLILSRH